MDPDVPDAPAVRLFEEPENAPGGVAVGEPESEEISFMPTSGESVWLSLSARPENELLEGLASPGRLAPDGADVTDGADPGACAASGIAPDPCGAANSARPGELVNDLEKDRGAAPEAEEA